MKRACKTIFFCVGPKLALVKFFKLICGEIFPSEIRNPLIPSISFLRRKSVLNGNHAVFVSVFLKFFKRFVADSLSWRIQGFEFWVIFFDFAKLVHQRIVDGIFHARLALNIIFALIFRQNIAKFARAFSTIVHFSHLSRNIFVEIKDLLS